MTIHAQNPQHMTLTTLIAATVITAVLHLGSDIFLPLAFAMLITFALSPLVSFLRHRGLPQLVSVLATVTLAFGAIGVFLLVVVSQLGQLAEQLPSFQANIVTKLEDLQASGSGNGLAARLGDVFASINSQIGQALPEEGEALAGAANLPPDPLPVRLVEDQSPLGMLTNLVLPLVSPIGTAGLVIVVVIFMLIERDELRDRFIRLVGSNDIHRTTQVLEEAGGRVAHYLLAQLLVNTIYAVPIGLGLWVIGVPNALLWGLMTLVLRFVPYIGSILSAAFPLFLAFAVSPDWSAVIWTAVLFGVVELITSNIIEPWLYGARTGVSALAIIVSAIFWAWVWGPMGLVLSTPLTVCLVVLGRHVPQFEMFDVLFGDRPVLAPEARLYQRLLVGDVVESAFRAEEALEEDWLADYHRDVGLPAMMMAQADHERGVITQAQEERMAGAAMRFLDELEPVVEAEVQELRAETTEGTALPGQGHVLAVLGGRSALDDVAARMLGQAAAAEGAEVRVLSHADLVPRRFGAVTGVDAPVILLSFLDTAPTRGAILQLRRIKRAAPQTRVGVVLWQRTGGSEGAWIERRVDPARIADVMAIGADFCVTGMEAALAEAFSDQKPLALNDTAPAQKRARRPRIAAV